MAIKDTVQTNVSADTVVIDSTAKRKAAATRRFVDKLKAASPGITPRMQQAIETYKRVKAERTTR